VPLDAFHPAVRAWFARRFPDGPTPPQVRGWPAIRSGRHTLIAAPTGSGKTLAAFLSAIDDLVRLGVERRAAGAPLPDETRVLYVSPLKALGNDVRKNLEEPLAGIRGELARAGLGDVVIRAGLRTGDTTPAERQALLRRPPHILVTTPESLFILLTSARGREALRTVRTVIVDEIHAVADDKRGAHLALTLERLERLVVHGTEGDRPPERPRRGRTADAATAADEGESPAAGGDAADAPAVRGDAAPAPDGVDGAGLPGLDVADAEAPPAPGRPPLGPAAGVPPVRIGLSATQQPIEEVARFLVGAKRVDAAGAPDCVIVDEGHLRGMELRVEIPGSPLSALASGEVWEEVYDRVAELVLENRTTLVFVNTRRMAERLSHHLSKRLGDDRVTSHHGSLSRERRLDAEERLKSGRLRALVATSSLELGIDVGSVDLVCQIGSPRAIAALLQRVGRSGRLRGAVARGRLFALSRDELVECAALLLSAREGLLDRLVIPRGALDVLAQQIVAEGASRDASEDELLELARGAWPYRDLAAADYEAVLAMLGDGYATARGRRAAWLHRDRVNRRLRARRGARLAAVSSGGAIPDTADFQVVLEPEGTLVGTLNEDFAIESMQGDVFQLGNTSWRILRVEAGRVRVEDARGQPPSIPFWLGEAPARTPELSEEVSRIRREVERRVAAANGDGAAPAVRWLVDEVGLDPAAAVQVVEYLDASRRVLGTLPTRDTLVLERFFDEAGGMQLVVHSPFGGRLNRAWGLALRKRFCRSFNFELQAAANEDAIVLSLGPQHSFPLIDVFRYLNAATARDLLVQALLAAPMFKTRWRWNAGRALAVLRQQGGRRTPPQLLRMRAEDLLAAAFPQAAACLENVVGDIQVPDHPLVRQTVEDCLTEAMDIEALEALLGRIERGEVRLVARDLPEPSPLAHEILNARPYAFLDDAPAEERRTLAVSTRRNLDVRTSDDLGTLDAAAIETVRRQAWPEPEDADEVHDALLWLGAVTAAEGEPWRDRLEELERSGRATLAAAAAGPLWAAAERLPALRLAVPGFAPRADLPPLPGIAPPADRESALVELLRGRIEGLGPVTAAALGAPLGLDAREVETALVALETEGVVLRGRFSPVEPGGEPALEWCHRRLLARIHRLTVERLRAEIEPATSAEFMRFLFRWQNAAPGARLSGPRGLLEVLGRLQGWQAPASAWERDLLPARLETYDPAWLDALCLSGEVVWGRLVAPAPSADVLSARPRTGPVRTSPVAFLLRQHADAWLRAAPAPELPPEALSQEAWEVLRALSRRGASFLQDLVGRTGLLPSQVERGLGELVSWGLVTADGFSGLRALVSPAGARGRRGRPARGVRLRRASGTQAAGRWSLLREPSADAAPAGGGRELAQAPGRDGGPETGGAGGGPLEREEGVERLARQFLARYGVVVRRMLEREPLLPPWREVLRVLRRLEMRGEIRGGRFLDGAAGEQFALPEAVELLRAVRRAGPDGTLVVLNGADPLNLTGIVTPGERIAATASNRIVWRDGVPVGARDGGAVRRLTPSGAEENGPGEADLERLLLRPRSAEVERRGAAGILPGLELAAVRGSGRSAIAPPAGASILRPSLTRRRPREAEVPSAAGVGDLHEERER
jgi:ATP-dependent Lhr-like helicase